eukprot:GGOE01042627.1.p1 GENE.GGOE01042627.1~~GGOE01042627.1.p1  ORF type:complete len:327 (-),score=48.63 GGOE01042627.1:369-1265(-)
MSSKRSWTGTFGAATPGARPSHSLIPSSPRSLAMPSQTPKAQTGSRLVLDLAAPSLASGAKPGPMDSSRSFLQAPAASLSSTAQPGATLELSLYRNGFRPTAVNPAGLAPASSLFAADSQSASSSRVLAAGLPVDPLRQVPVQSVVDSLPSAALNIPTQRDQDDELRCWVTVFGIPHDLTHYVIRKFAEYGTVTRHSLPQSSTNYIHLRFSREFEAKKALAQSHRKLNDALIVGVIACTDRSVLSHQLDAPRAAQPVAAPGPSSFSGLDISERPSKRMRTDWWGKGWGKVLELFIGSY